MVHGALHLCGPAMGVYAPVHSIFQPSTFIYDREAKSQGEAKNCIAGMQNNLISPSQKQENGELMCLPEVMTQSPRQ